MANILYRIDDYLITSCFLLLFFLVPFILTPFNYELFEYNKMMATYGLSIIIAGAWLIKMILAKKIYLKRTPFDIPLILFLLSQILSTVFSWDRHLSIWGYYSRFNGGLLSTVSYILLYYAFVSNFPKEKIKTLLYAILFSGSIVAVYGILEHLGIDKNIWVQDVQNRVFSTLGQPNWLGAYLAVLIPLSLGLGFDYLSNLNTQIQDKNQKSPPKADQPLAEKIKNQNENVKSINLNFKLILFGLISLLFYLTLIFTKSRSGFIGLWISLAVFWLMVLFIFKKRVLKLFLILNSLFLILNFLFGTPFEQFNKFTLPQILINNQQTTTNQQSNDKPTGGSLIEVGVTESGNIRRIVWKGAVDIFRHFPLFGTGVETFALSYYKFRPAEHNMTSEWDFLYNKAHNEYLNFAATTGAFGLGSYLLIIIVFTVWTIRNLKSQILYVKTISQNHKSKDIRISDMDLRFNILHLSLFSSWLTILITNFFGFSVVIIQLFFYLLPAVSLVLYGDQAGVDQKPTIKQYNNITIKLYQWIIMLGLLSFIIYLLFTLMKFWYADILFARGYHQNRSLEYNQSYQNIKRAIILNNNEPLYYDELVIPAIQLSGALNSEKDKQIAQSLKDEAVAASNIALSISPNNVNFWKTRTRLYYALSEDDNKYLAEVKNSLETALFLSPTDPKITYNLALIYDKLSDKSKAYDILNETIRLKPDYRDAYYALALFYQRDRQKDKARENLNFILTKLNPNDEEAKKKLEEIK